MKEQLEKQIIDATITLFNEKGLKLTMDDIAGSLAISKKTIYKHYDSKEEIFDQIVDYIFDDIKKKEQEILDEEGLELEVRVRRLLAAFPERFTEIDFTKLGDLKAKYPKIYKKLTKRLDSGWEPTMALLEQGKEEGIYRKDANFTIFKVMMDASVARFFETDTLKKSKISYIEALNQVVDILLTGIKA